MAGIDRLHLHKPLAVKDLLSAVTFAVQPLDDLNLAALLVSPLLSWNQDQLFELAGLRQASFRAVSPQWTPPSYADTRAAWEGTMPDQQDVSVRIEAAAYRGLPVAFTIVWPWTPTGREGPFVRSRTDRIAGATCIVLGVALLAVAGIVARRHLSAGRGDVRGATRLALFVVALLVTLLVEVPLDNQFSEWTVTTLPANWQQLRDRWEWFHVIRSWASVAGLALLLAGALFWRDDATRRLAVGPDAPGEHPQPD